MCEGVFNLMHLCDFWMLCSCSTLKSFQTRKGIETGSVVQ